MFEQFLDQSDYEEFKKSLKKVISSLTEIKHFEAITPLVGA
jgi:hypothetical protein